MDLKVSCAIIFKRERIFVAQLGKESAHPFEWEFPGGKIKSGETAEECIKREILEELDIEIELVARLDAVQYDYGFRRIELIPFVCKVKAGIIRLQEHINHKWIKLEEITDINMAGADKRLIWKNRLMLEKYSREKMNNA